MIKELPAHFEENIDKLYQDLFVDNKAVQYDIMKLVKELEHILK